jgi:hypothetical protein|nr:hypothetical protein [Blastomonas sp. CCH5-A3]
MIDIGAHDFSHPVEMTDTWQGRSWLSSAELPPLVVAFVHVPVEYAQSTCEVLFDLGNGDAMQSRSLGIAELIDTDGKEDLALHWRHMIDGALSAAKLPPLGSGKTRAHAASSVKASR